MTRLLNSYFFIMALLLLAACKSPQPAVSGKQYTLVDSVQAETDSNIYRLADPFRQQLSLTMSETVCTSDAVLERGNPEGTLGDFVADLCLAAGNRAAKVLRIDTADFIVLNNGGLRKPLPQGTITLGDLYEVMPFENRLFILELTGSQVMELCDFISSMNGTPVSGIRFSVNKENKAARVMIAGKALEENSTYRVMTADYLANGGDKFDVFKKAAKKSDTSLKIRDAMIAHTRQLTASGKHISIRLDGRISHED